MVITSPNSSAIYAGESKGPIKGYEEKLDRPEPTMDASLYRSDVHQQLVTDERHEGPEKATVKSLNSVAHYFHMPYHHIGQLVRPYADRNVLVRNDVREFVAKRKWSSLGGRLAHGRLCRIAQGLSEEGIPHGRRGYSSGTVTRNRLQAQEE